MARAWVPISGLVTTTTGCVQSTRISSQNSNLTSATFSVSRCTRQHFHPGTDIFSQGEPYTTSYLIRSGVVRTYYVAPSGKEITIAYWPEGTLIGGPNVFKERRSHIWSAQAVTEVAAEQIRGHDLEELTMRIPRLAHYIIETLTFKLHWVSVLLQAFGTQSVRARVARLLLQLGKRYGVEGPQGTVIAHHFSHDELGRMVGATRCWVTLALKELKNEGIIATHGRDISVLSMKALKAKSRGSADDLANSSNGVAYLPIVRMISDDRYPIRPILTIPTMIFATAPSPAAMSKFQIKNPIPPPLPPAAVPPTRNQLASDYHLPRYSHPHDGSYEYRGQDARQHDCAKDSESRCAHRARRLRISKVDASRTANFVSTIVKNAPRKITKPIDRSCVGQNRIEAGTHAIGGIGRRISNVGKTMPKTVRLSASTKPKGMPIITATENPLSTRKKLSQRSNQ